MDQSPRYTRSDQTVHFHFDSSLPLYVWDLGFHRTPSGHCYGPAVRPYYLVHLIEQGKGFVERDGIRTILGAGDAFVIRPDEVVTYKADETDPWTYCWIAFFGEFSHTLLQQTTCNLFPKYRKSGLLVLKNGTSISVSDQIGALSILFSVLDSIKAESQQEKQDVVTAALGIIEHNYFRNLDVSHIAKDLNMSRAHFTTVFTQKIGESPYNYLTKVRIRKAEEFLLSSSLSVTEIAYSVGFSSIERFSEMFKKYTALSPLAYRKQKSETP